MVYFHLAITTCRTSSIRVVTATLHYRDLRVSVSITADKALLGLVTVVSIVAMGEPARTALGTEVFILQETRTRKGLTVAPPITNVSTVTVHAELHGKVAVMQDTSTSSALTISRKRLMGG